MLGTDIERIESETFHDDNIAMHCYSIMISLTIIAWLVTIGEALGVLEPVEDLLIHEPHVGVVLDGAQLVVAVEILGGAEPAAHQAAGLT